MFVRWTSVRITDWYEGYPDWRPRYSHRVMLLECRRVDGKPRQRFVCHLGTLRSFDKDHRKGPYHVNRREEFWTRVDRKLDEVGLDAVPRSAIEAKLQEVVKRPEPGEVEAVEAARRAEYRKLFTL
jgi:hypothetical protein